MFHGVTITSTMFHGMKRINLVVPDEFHDKLMAEKPVHKMLSSFCLDLIAAELDRVAKLAPCPAHAGNKEVHVIQRDECVKITHSGVEKTSLPSIDVGEDVGKGVQGGTPGHLGLLVPRSRDRWSTRMPTAKWRRWQRSATSPKHLADMHVAFGFQEIFLLR